MAWRQIGDKSLLERTSIQITDAYTRHQASMNQDLFSHFCVFFHRYSRRRKRAIAAHFQQRDRPTASLQWPRRSMINGMFTLEQVANIVVGLFRHCGYFRVVPQATMAKPMRKPDWFVNSTWYHLPSTNQSVLCINFIMAVEGPIRKYPMSVQQHTMVCMRV